MRRVVVLALAVLALAAAQPASPAVPKRGELRVLVALVSWGPQPATPAEVQTELTRVASWFDDTSFSQLHVVAETTPTWLPIPHFAACSAINPGLHDAADAALRGAAVDLSRYDVRAYLFPAVGDCPFAGRASLVAGWIELNSLYRADLIEHELGHSLGLSHSRATPCIVWRAGCPVEEYGDPYDVMGGGFGPFNGFHKLALGWIRGTSIVRDGTYTVEQLERPSPSPQALTIETAAARYVIDHREASLEPVPVRPDPSNGVLIYRWDGEEGPILLSAGGAPRAYPLPVGRTYEVSGVFTLTPTTRAGTHVDVSFAWTDRIAPQPPALVEPADGARERNVDAPVLAWEESAEDGSGLAGYELNVDGVTTVLAADETVWAPERLFAAGTHSWSVAAVDRAGNRARSETRTFVIEKLSQTVVFLVGGRRCGSSTASPCRVRGRTFGFAVRAVDVPERTPVSVRLDRRVSGWRTELRRTRPTGVGGDAAFAGLPALRPGLWRVTATVAGTDVVDPERIVAYVRLLTK